MSLNDKAFMRYNRHVMLPQIGESGQALLLQSHVVIVGMGGIGCPAAQYLVASGIGKMTIIDHDVVELSNLQRQILFTEDDLGRNKVDAAKKRLNRLNSDTEINAVAKSVFDCELDWLVDDADVLLDCTDNPDTRLFINEKALNAGIKLVSASAIQGSGQLISFDFSEPNSPCYGCLFPNGAEQELNCANSGVLSPLLGTMGSLQATETLRLLQGNKDQINRLMMFDAWGMELRKFHLKKDVNCTICSMG
jgi:molybdopterin/thiamine biosynthesis adenylyltransferase